MSGSLHVSAERRIAIRLCACALAISISAGDARSGAPEAASPGTAPIPAGTTAATAKLAIDEPVESGMAIIRSAVIDNHTLITHRRFPPPMAAGLKARIERTVATIRAGTTLTGPSRTALDGVLAEIEQGTALVGPGNAAIAQIDGLFLMTRALERYGATFDHPAWAPIQER